MKQKQLKETLGWGVCFRVFLFSLSAFLVICLWQIGFVVEGASQSLTLTLILFTVFLLMSVAIYLSIMKYLHCNLIQPLGLIRQADEESDLRRAYVKIVDFKDIVPEDLQKIATFRNQLGRSLKEKELRQHLKTPLEEIYTEINKLTDGIIAALEQANLYNDDDTGSHMQRLGLYSRLMGERHGLPEEFIAEIERYAPLHDVGKIGMPDDILKKPGRLNPQEWAVMKTHAKIGYDILKSVGMSPIAQNIALFHHERWTGTGYPEGLKGEEIPVEARLVAIADVFDALVNERVYKPPFPREKVEKIMLSEIGRHFDPNLGKIAYESLDELYAIFEANKDAS